PFPPPASLEQRRRQARDGRRAAEGREAAFVRRAIEEAQQAKDGELAGAFLSCLAQPPLVRRHRFERVTALRLLIRLLEVNAAALEHVALVHIDEVSSDKIQGEGVAAHTLDELRELFFPT